MNTDRHRFKKFQLRGSCTEDKQAQSALIRVDPRHSWFLKLNPLWVLVCGLFACIARAAVADVVKIELPRETAGFKLGPNVALANSRCLVCHSADYIASQPAMPKAFWKASVQKMQQKYGAVILDSEVDLLAEYLVRTYGNEKVAQSAKTSQIPFIHPDAGESQSRDSAKLAELNGCLSCHGAEKKIVGPALKDIAAKYQGAADGLQRISNQINNGGGGQWGTIPMPAYTHLTQSEVKALAEWVLKH